LEKKIYDFLFEKKSFFFILHVTNELLMLRKVLFFIFCFASVFATDHPPLLSIATGAYSVTKTKYTTAEFRIEYKFERLAKKLRPCIGLMATAKASVYAYAGLGLDLIICNRFIFSPNFAAGYYYKGNGRDLGYPLEFRSGIEAGWRFDNHSRLGIHFYHLSNATLGKKNPGEESLVLFYAFPLTFLSKTHK